MTPEQQAIAHLRSPQTIRANAHHLLQLAEQDALTHWQFHPEQWDHVVAFVTRHIQANYPTLEIPYHSRIRHFDAGGKPRARALQDQWADLSPQAQGRAWYDLIIVSVLLDAGAGPEWSYTEPGTEDTYSRSEGLAVASYHMFQDGLFSAHKDAPCRVDAEILCQLSAEKIAQGMQVSTTNPMVGLEGRAALLQSLGKSIQEHPKAFAQTGRPGGLFDNLWEQVVQQKLPASTILAAILEHLGDIWPGRYTINRSNLGDVWRHSKSPNSGLSEGYIPFHKLSQWLTYSMLEPLEFAGIEVTDLNALTGLAEYRNGGLFMDLGVLSLRDPQQTNVEHPTDAELVVEWRALTIALLDRIGDAVRQQLGLSEERFPLAKVLQGGTWSAGRIAAKQKRPDGSPPLQLLRDGTVF